MAANTDGLLSARSVSSSKMLGSGTPAAIKNSAGATWGNTGPSDIGCQNFMRTVERTTDAFVAGDDTAVEDVRRILLDVRSQYDSVHFEAEQKDARLKSLKESIRACDGSNSTQGSEISRLEESATQLENQLKEIKGRIHETRTNRKVYVHMLARLQKEQAILKQKMLKMEDHVERKRNEVKLQGKVKMRMELQRISKQQAHQSLERDAAVEQEICEQAREVMDAELDHRKDANKRRADFESWRHKVALEAANEAFNASAGRLRKLYAIEKLAGNLLQQTTFEQIQRSQATEDGFQKVREVTGLADVMDIVHKFLNREVEHEQLKSSVKDAEVRLDALRKNFDELRRKTEGITFDVGPSSARTGDVFKEVEGHEQMLADSMKDHEACRQRLQKTILQVEHLKRWCARVGKLLSIYQDTSRVESWHDFPIFFKAFNGAVKSFVADVKVQIDDGKVQRKMLSQVQTREYYDQTRWLVDVENQKNNRRVKAGEDGKPAARQGQDEDLKEFEEGRIKCKAESTEITTAKEQSKRRPKV